MNLTKSKLDYSGGFGDVVEEVLDPLRAVIWVSFLSAQSEAPDKEYFGYTPRQVPEEIYNRLEEWRRTCKRIQIWRNPSGNTQTVLLVSIENPATREQKMTVLARYLEQPKNHDKPLKQETVMKTVDIVERLQEKNSEDKEGGVSKINLIVNMIFDVIIFAGFTSSLMLFFNFFIWGILEKELERGQTYSDLELASLFMSLLISCIASVLFVRGINDSYHNQQQPNTRQAAIEACEAYRRAVIA